MDKQKSFEDATMVETSSAVNQHDTHQKPLIPVTSRTRTNSLSSSFLAKSEKKKTPKQISAKEGCMVIVKSSWVNLLLVFVPIGIASNYVWSPTVTFIMNFLAIIPLAKLLGFATEDIALRTGEVSSHKFINLYIV